MSDERLKAQGQREPPTAFGVAALFGSLVTLCAVGALMIVFWPSCTRSTGRGGETPTPGADRGEDGVASAEHDEDLALDTAEVVAEELKEAGDETSSSEVGAAAAAREERWRNRPSNLFKATEGHEQLRQDVLAALCPALAPHLDGYVILNLDIANHTTVAGRDVLRGVTVTIAGMGREHYGERAPLKSVVSAALADYLDGKRDLPDGGPRLNGGIRMRVDFAECLGPTE